MLGPEQSTNERCAYRKITRKIYDFSPEQMHNLAAIVWLYRGQRERFLGLVKGYLGRVCAESAAMPTTLAPFETTLADLRGRFDPLADAESELREAATLYEADTKKLLAALTAYGQKYTKALLAARYGTSRPVRSGFETSIG